VSDEAVREAERRWRETGAVEDEARWLVARVRAGRLAPGHPAAELTAGRCDPAAPAWIDGLERLPESLKFVAIRGLAERLIEELAPPDGADWRVALDLAERMVQGRHDPDDIDQQMAWELGQALLLHGGSHVAAALRECLAWVGQQAGPIDVRRAVEASARLFAARGPQPTLHSPDRRSHELSGFAEVRRAAAAHTIPALLV
jgi:hypothetical protein